jgi:hypothetical protein
VLLGHQQVARVIGKVQEKAPDQFGHPTKIGLFHGFSYNVVKTTINHPPNHHFYRWYKPFSQMGGL